jgi:membrane fusion protein (multidrug efflux system)
LKAGLNWLGTFALLLSSCGANEEQAREEPVPIRVVRVEPSDALRPVIVSGTVARRLETPLGFTSAGQIARIGVQEGDIVRKGQLLASLDTTQLDAALASAQAERVRADAELVRSAKLLEKGWVTQPRVDNARAAAKAAAANVQSARFATSTARILAPASGVVLARLAEPAQVVAAGSPVLVLGEDSGGLILRVPLNDRDVARIRKGAPARVRVDGLGGQVLDGQVIEIGGRAQASTGSFSAEIGLPDDPRLRSGLIGSAEITAVGSGETSGVRVPPSAMFAARAGEAFVYVVGTDNKVRRRKIRIGDVEDGGARALSGVAPGEWVAVSGIDRLSDGLAVKPARASR